MCAEVKRLLQNYQGTLEGLDKAHVFYTNNAFILTTCDQTKRVLKDYERALENLDKAHVFDQTMYSF